MLSQQTPHAPQRGQIIIDNKNSFSIRQVR
jgi:hypothetical protein